MTHLAGTPLKAEYTEENLPLVEAGFCNLRKQVIIAKIIEECAGKIVFVLRGFRQCCGSGSGIRCIFDPWIRDPGWVESQHPDPGCGINNPDHIF
jgi:hypothetical protein